jgi:hypothetical protein
MLFKALSIGVLALALLVVPALALAEHAVVPEGISYDPVSSTAQPAEGYTPQGPYANYFYLFNHGSLAFPEGSSDIVESYRFFTGRFTTLKKAPSSTVNASAFVDLPITGVASYSGTHPKVRYAFIKMWNSATNRGAIEQIDATNGNTIVKTVYPKIDGNGAWVEYTVDLGSYYDFDRGMLMSCLIYNTDTVHTASSQIAGYGAKAEW